MPSKTKEIIFITENGCDSVLHENYSSKWIIFDHNIGIEKYSKYNMKAKNIIPFDVVRHNLAKFTDKKI